MGINLSSCGAVIADASLLRPIPSPETGHFPVRRGDGEAQLVVPLAGRIFLRQDLRIFVLFLSLSGVPQLGMPSAPTVPCAPRGQSGEKKSHPTPALCRRGKRINLMN